MADEMMESARLPRVEPGGANFIALADVCPAYVYVLL